MAIAAGGDAWNSSDELTVAELLTYNAAALVIAAAMALYGRFRRQLLGTRATVAPSASLAAVAQPSPPRAVFETLSIGVVCVSANGRVSYCNPAFRRLWAIDDAQRTAAGASTEALLLVMARSLARPTEQLRLLLSAPPSSDMPAKLELPLADGRLLTQLGQRVGDDAQATSGHVWLFEDVTAERRNARVFSQLAARDALTGHYNRHRFNEEITRMMADAQRNGTRLALLLLDLDGFKKFNVTFGRRAGDAQLIRVANEVAAQVRRNEIFARIDGDDFAILVPDAEDEVLEILADRVTRSVGHTRTELDGQALRVSCSCGIAIYPDHAATPDTLTARAGTAMVEAKAFGKNAWRFYQAPADAAAHTPASPLAPLSPEGRIRHALDHNLLALHYQGIYSTQQRTLKHYEVLLRVSDPDKPGALLPTADFIAAVEKSSKIVELDRWVLREAIQKLADDTSLPALAVNVSGRSLDDDTLPEFIAQELMRRGVPAQRLLVELTETAAVSDMHDARRFIEALHGMGCGVSLDDFGTGFSSFGYLKHLSVDAIKIDGLFIRDLASDHENQLFVRAIVSVARGMHKTTIAECVENEASLKLLAALGVDYVQGFHLERPSAQPAAAPVLPIIPPRRAMVLAH